jgi:SAM-dependent methyltransferase
MFNKSARFYDAIYSWKDYEGEAQKLRATVDTHARRPAETLLDVACGTGKHLSYLQAYFRVEGLDLDPELRAVARERLPDVPFHLGDMTDFRLGATFDVVTCLFSAIAYAGSVDRLNAAVACMAGHLNPGGVLIVEPWFTPEQWEEGGLHAIQVNEPDLKITRMNISGARDGVSILDFHYLVGTPKGIDYFSEHHELALFTHDDYIQAFAAAALHTTHDPEGISGRGLYVGVRD